MSAVLSMTEKVGPQSVDRTQLLKVDKRSILTSSDNVKDI